MALIPCPECGREVSERADFCPGCGHPSARGRSRSRLRGGRARVAAIVAVMLAAGWVAARYAPGFGTGRDAGPREAGEMAELPTQTARMAPAAPVDSAGERPAEAPRPADSARAPKPDLEPAMRYESWEVEALPELANAEEVDSLLEAAYPEPLRDARVEGTVRVRLLVRADGSVDPATISIEDASAEAFADAALPVAQRMRFRPAIVGGITVSVWVTVPIIFEVVEETDVPFDENPPVRTSIT